MVVLDSNIWIAFLNEEDTRHDKAVQLYYAITDDFLVPEYILGEICSILAARKKKQLADSFIVQTQDNEHIELLPSNPQFFAEVRQTFVEYRHHNLSFVDVSLLVLSKLYPVATLDRALYKLLKKK